MGIVETDGSPARGPGTSRSSGAGWWVPTLVGTVAFWLVNLAISLTPVAAAYRAALSIAYVPMLVEAAAGGFVVAGAVAFLLTRIPERFPGGGPLRKALLLALVALVLLTMLLEVPAKMRSDVADSGHWLLVATAINAIRILALGASIGLVTRPRTTGRDRHHVVTRREAQ